MLETVHYACDVGSTRQGNFGWARVRTAGGRVDARGGRGIDRLINHVRDDLDSGRFAVTLGMEFPMYLPIPGTSDGLSRGRRGEGQRSCFAPAGSYVATLGLHQLAFILRGIKRKGTLPTLDWRRWEPEQSVVLFWEAFVSEDAHCNTVNETEHVRDAVTAAAAVEDCLRLQKNGGNLVCVGEGPTTLSLVGCALVWSGSTSDLHFLSQDVLVVRPELPYSGAVTNVD